MAVSKQRPVRSANGGECSRLRYCHSVRSSWLASSRTFDGTIFAGRGQSVGLTSTTSLSNTDGSRLTLGPKPSQRSGTARIEKTCAFTCGTPQTLHAQMVSNTVSPYGSTCSVTTMASEPQEDKLHGRLLILSLGGRLLLDASCARFLPAEGR